MLSCNKLCGLICAYAINIKEKTMKRRITALLLSAAMCLSLCACGETEAKLAVGETASTDIAEFTLEDAQFAYYLNDGTLIPTDEPNPNYSASAGHCLVSLTFTLTNTDRAGYLSFCNPFPENRWKPNFVLEYEGKEYPVNSHSLGNKNGETFSMKDTLTSMANAVIVDKETGAFVREPQYSSYLLRAGSTVTIRAAGVVAVDPENLTDGFELSVDVPNSKGEYETFTYAVPAMA